MKKIMYFVLFCVNFYSLFSNIFIQKDLTSNFDQRVNLDGELVKPKYIIIHYTANCSENSILKWFKNYSYPASAHYLINSKGSITMTVDPKYRAWHAGKSYWKGCTEINAYSIGIEIINPGSTEQKKDPCTKDSQAWSKKDCHLILGSNNCWYPFTKEQINSLIVLCKYLMKKYTISSENVIGHSDIAPGRKIDPGPLFPWRLLAEHGIGIWPTIIHENKKIDIQKAQEYLKLIGYNNTITGIIDEQTIKNIIAFQMHFRPTNIDGELDQETFNILQSLTTS